jgi:hypothetical protein
MDSPEKRSVDAYMATISRLEPDIAPIDASAFYASAAISLKRQADAMESMAHSMAQLAEVGLTIQNFGVGTFTK